MTCESIFRCRIWEASIEGSAAAPLDGADFKCLCRCGSRSEIRGGPSSRSNQSESFNLVMIIIFIFKKAPANICSISIQGAAIDRILGEIVHHTHVKAPIDYVLCVGHFLPKVRQLMLFYTRICSFLSIL